MSLLSFIAEYQVELLAGLRVTLALAVIAWTSGLVFGTTLGVLSMRYPRFVGWPMQVAAHLVSAIPVLVLLLWMHYPFQHALGVVIPPFFTAALTLSFVNVIVVGESWRTHLRVFPTALVEAGKVAGLTDLEIARFVQLPILFRQLLPSLVLSQLAILQATLFASLISVDELFRSIQRINASSYRTIDAFSVLAAMFLLVCVPLQLLAVRLRHRFERAEIGT